MRPTASRQLVALVALVLGTASAAQESAQPVSIGILTTGNAATARWTPTADYLSQRIPGRRFVIVPLTQHELRDAMEQRLLEFVLTDAGEFVELEHDYGARAVVTRQIRQHDKAHPYFAATIVVSVGRADLKQLTDLRSGSLIVNADDTFGVVHLAWREFIAAGTNPLRDFTQIVRDARPPEQALLAVLNGKVDAAIVPSGTLERLGAKERIDPTAFRVLNEIRSFDFPLMRSTPAYPEWPLAAARHTSTELVRAVAAALLNMHPDDAAASAGGYAGWTVAPSYKPVDDLYRVLHLGHYRRNSDALDLGELVPEYTVFVLVGLLSLFGMAGVTIYVLRLNRTLGIEIHWSRRVQDKLQTFFRAVEQTADAVMITDPDGRIEYVNPAFTRVTGYSAEEARGYTPSLLRSGMHGAEFYRRLWDTIRRGDVFRHEIINRRKDGTRCWQEVWITPIRDAAERITHFVATARDVTEQRHAEEEAHLRQEQLAHTARVNIIGEMAASIAHEMSQPLTAIINYTNGCMRRVRTKDFDTDQIADVLDQVIVQAQRAADAVLHLRRFVTKRKPQRRNADINTLVTQAASLAAGETRKRGIGIALDLSKDLPSTCVDGVQIEQVILNLLRNGAEALASATDQARELRLSTALADDGAIEVAVSDTGPGLPPRLAAKLFEPFSRPSRMASA